MINYFSVCDGIGAAHVAWQDIPELNCVGVSEIEPFPSAVVDHHWQLPNYGDMTKLLTNQQFLDATISLLIGGTPCQSFSVAGLRAGLDDDRGNLSLEFARILYAKRIPTFLWENVPGVLSSNEGADFAAILSAWTGHDLAAQLWAESGIITAATPQNYSIAYRILDAQYFGVPQRRRRVFVVGYLGTDWRPPTAVLFEQDSLRRDFTPSREKRQKPTNTAADSFGTTGVSNTLTCEYGEQAGQDLGNADLLVNQRVNDAVTSKWAKGSGGPAGDEVQNDVLHLPKSYRYVDDKAGIIEDDTAQILKAKGSQTDERSVGAYVVASTIDCRNDVLNEEISGTLQSKENGGHSLNYQNPVVYGIDQSLNINPNHINALLANGNGQVGNGAVAFSQNVREEVRLIGGDGQTTAALTAEQGTHQQTYIAAYGMQSTMIGRNDNAGPGGLGIKEEVSFTLTLQETPALVHTIARRLTPLECERLQGFPDNYTNIQYKGKLAADGPRYKAIGNSWAVPVVKWIGQRIVMVNGIIDNLPK